MSDAEEREALRRARQIDQLEELPEDPRATRDRAELQRWNDFAASPWIRPPTVADAVAQAKEKRTIGLLEAVDMMAFGTEEPPQDVIEVSARRLQACRALCDGAHAEAFSLWGRLGKDSDKLEPIPPQDFGTSRRLGDGSNVLELDASSVPAEDEAQFDRLHIGKWFDVRIGDRQKFLAWVLEEGAVTPKIVDPQEPANLKKSSGRKKGDGSFAKLDGPILSEMDKLISEHQAASPEEAARMLAEKAHGAGTLDSKTERLAKRYRASKRAQLGGPS